MLQKHGPRASASQLFQILLNFHEFFQNSIETSRKCVLFLLEDTVRIEARKITRIFRLSEANSLAGAMMHYVNSSCRDSYLCFYCNNKVFLSQTCGFRGSRGYFMLYSPAVEFLKIVVRFPALSYSHSRHEYFYIYFCLSNSFMTSSYSKLIKNF